LNLEDKLGDGELNSLILPWIGSQLEEKIQRALLNRKVLCVGITYYYFRTMTISSMKTGVLSNFSLPPILWLYPLGAKPLIKASMAW
jgi:hypothetical protein